MTADMHGLYACATETIIHWSGPQAGTSETLEPGEYHFVINTATGLMSSYEFGETIASPAAVAITWRPEGQPQMVARRNDELFTLRIALDEAPMRFTGLGPVSVLHGTCTFEPQASR